MRYATFSLASDSILRLGVVAGDEIIDAALAWPGTPPSLLALIQQGPQAWDRLRARANDPTAGPRYALEAVRLHAPLPRPPKNVFCVGRNYEAHVREGAAAYGREARLPAVPVFFTKAPTTVIGPFDDIPRHAAITAQLDWEAELAVVIGIGGRDIPGTTALDHVFGYTIVNDITARDLQQQHGQWFKGKSLDGSCPMGPVVVTPDEFGDPQRKRLSLRVNGAKKQDATTADMIFTVATIIESLSQGLTLEPGDIIATGTPEGVGLGRTPQEFLAPGDVVETEIEGIGVMRNRVTEIGCRN